MKKNLEEKAGINLIAHEEDEDIELFMSSWDVFKEPWVSLFNDMYYAVKTFYYKLYRTIKENRMKSP